MIKFYFIIITYKGVKVFKIIIFFFLAFLVTIFFEGKTRQKCKKVIISKKININPDGINKCDLKPLLIPLSYPSV